MTTTTVRFGPAFQAAQGLAEALAVHSGRRVALVHDVVGRFRFVLEDREGRGASHPIDRDALAAWLEPQAKRLGGFDAGRDRLLYASRLLQPEGLFSGPGALHLGSDTTYVDRSATGLDWSRPPLPNDAPTPPRLVLYGVKGGVGRSTATAALAWHLARRGHRVLAVDLDLESPGLGSLLVPMDRHPEAGVVDWLVEQGVEQADDALLDAMVTNADFAPPFDAAAAGVVHVVSAAGRADLQPTTALAAGPIAPSYLDKLTRARLDLPRTLHEATFAGRLASLLDALERRFSPTVVLIDSRSGLHEVAAIALTRLGAECLLFAGGSPSTWSAYHLLLHRWGTRLSAEARSALLDRLHTVAALVPEKGRTDYLNRFAADAYETFSQTLYPDASEGEPEEFPEASEDAPHSPVPIRWQASLTGLTFSALETTPAELEAAFEDLFSLADELAPSPSSSGNPS